MVSLFLSTALVISSAGCGAQPQSVFDQNGNPIAVEDDDDDGGGGGFFGPILAPFGFSKKHSSKAGVVKSPGISSGSSSTSQNSVNSTKPVGGSSSTGGTGISSGSHGGIGGGGSSAS